MTRVLQPLWAVTWATVFGLSLSAAARQPATSLPHATPPVAGEAVGSHLRPLPFRDDTEVLHFLETAEVVSKKRISEGINGVDKVLLQKDGIRMHAAFRDVKVDKLHVRLARGGTQLNFRDDCIFEVAAYRLSLLLGLQSIPPTVIRKLGRRTGTLQVWIEDAMTEKKRVKRGIQPARHLEWKQQIQTMHLFDNLIYNDDRNQGNLLIDPDWKVWLIDHTRAFRRHKQLKTPDLVQMCSKQVWEALQRLDAQRVEAELEGLLRSAEIRALMIRRDRLLEHLEELIALHGEQQVLF